MIQRDVDPNKLTVGEKVQTGLGKSWVNPSYWSRQFVTAQHVANNVPNCSRVLELGKDVKNLHYLNNPVGATLIVPPSNYEVKEGPIYEARARRAHAGPARTTRRTAAEHAHVRTHSAHTPQRWRRSRSPTRWKRLVPHPPCSAAPSGGGQARRAAHSAHFPSARHDPAATLVLRRGALLRHARRGAAAGGGRRAAAARPGAQAVGPVRPRHSHATRLATAEFARCSAPPRVGIVVAPHWNRTTLGAALLSRWCWLGIRHSTPDHRACPVVAMLMARPSWVPCCRDGDGPAIVGALLSRW
jgi:hypothetical protein